jgi:hypothetical protein
MKISLSFIPALLLALFLPLSSGAEGLPGTWRALELDSGYFKQVEFVVENGTLTMRSWSSVNGGEMAAEALLVKSPISAKEVSSITPGSKPITLHQQSGFKNSTYEVSLRNEGLHIRVTDAYTDDSGRGTRKHDLHFLRGRYEDALALAPGKESEIIESGWLGIWKNRDENTRGIAQLTIRDLEPVAMSTWGIMGAKIATRPGTAIHLPLEGDEARDPDAKGRIEATEDLGWAKVTYKMKLHRDGLTVVTETDHTDPNRPDQEFEYEFVRGAWTD